MNFSSYGSLMVRGLIYCGTPPLPSGYIAMDNGPFFLHVD